MENLYLFILLQNYKLEYNKIGLSKEKYSIYGKNPKEIKRGFTYYT